MVKEMYQEHMLADMMIAFTGLAFGIGFIWILYHIGKKIERS